MAWLGIMLGLTAAFTQSLSYLLSRQYTVGRARGTLRLVVTSHMLQGAACVPLTIVLWPRWMPGPAAWGWWLIAECAAYFAGQIGLFYALRHTDASRVAPLLALKIVTVAVLAIALLGESLAPMQWLAVAFALVAAVILNYSGGKMPWRGVVGALVACLGYSLSDLCVVGFVDATGATDTGDRLHASLVGVSLSYVLIALVGLPTLRWLGTRRWADWRDSVPYSAVWLGSMMLLFGTFGVIGVVHGNIIQSTRGLMSIAMGVLVAKLGHHHLEQHVPRGVLARRAVAAALMVIAIALYQISAQSA